MIDFDGDIDSADAEDLARYLGRTGDLQINSVYRNEINGGNKTWRVRWSVSPDLEHYIKAIHSGDVDYTVGYSLTESLRKVAKEAHAVLHT